MKLVDRHEEGQDNPREEVAIDSQRTYVIVWSSQLLPPLHSRFFSKVATTLPDLLGKKWLFLEWDELCHQAVGELKNKLTLPPVLKFAEFDKFDKFAEFALAEC
jgi:hypothetical protein